MGIQDINNSIKEEQKADKKKAQVETLKTLEDTVAETVAETKLTNSRIQPAILPSDTTGEKPFIAMLNGTATNQLISLNSNTTRPVIDVITGNATIEQGTLRVFIDSYNKLTGGLRVSTSKLLDACTIALTSRNQYRSNGALETGVEIPLNEYVAMLGKPLTKASIDETRKRVKEDLETLFSISIEWKETSKRNTKDYAKMRILSSQGIKRGNILVRFSPEFAQYLIEAYIMQYPKALLKIDGRNPSSYHLGRKLLLHHSIYNNQQRGTANIISVRALLNICPDIPTYEEVMSGDRAVDRRIKSPFETALNALDFITWEYSNSKSVPLTDGQLASTTYADFIALFIKFTVKDFPDPTPCLEARAEEIKAKATKKKAHTKKKTDKLKEKS